MAYRPCPKAPLRQYDKILDLDPGFRRTYEGKGFTFLSSGNVQEAIRHLEQYHEMVGNPLKGLAGLGYAYGLAGMTEKARDCLARIYQRKEVEPHSSLEMEFALIYAGLGEYEKVFEYIKELYEKRANVVCLGMIYCLRYPILAELKTDPRFIQIMGKMGLN